MDQQPTAPIPEVPEPGTPNTGPTSSGTGSGGLAPKLIAVVVVILIVGAGVAGSIWMLRDRADLEQRTEDAEERLADLEEQIDAEDESEDETTGTDEPAEETADENGVAEIGEEELATYQEDGRHIGLITDISQLEDLTTRLEIDYVLFLGGAEADAAAAARGDETPVPNDYYVVNDNPLLRTFIVNPATRVTLEAVRNPDESLTMGNFEMSLSDFIDDHWFVDVDWYDSWFYWIEVDQGEIVDIQQQYTP